MTRVHCAWASALILLLLAAAPLRAQELWYKTYDDAVSAYQRKDYATAAQKFKASMDEPGAPAVRDRGPDVVRVSQQRGYMPDYYLALIYVELRQWQDASVYAAVTRGYRRLPAPERAQMDDAIAQARRASGDPRSDHGPEIADLFSKAATAMAAGQFTDARGSIGDAEKLGANADQARRFRQSIDDGDFDAGLRDATTARDAGRYADARAIVDKRLRPLSVDAARKAQIDPFSTSVDGRERHDRYAGLMEKGRQLLTSQQYAAVRDAARQAGDAASSDAERGAAQDLTTRATAQETFANLLGEARLALGANRLAEARAAVKQLRAMNIPSADLEDLDVKLGAREREATSIKPTIGPNTVPLPPALAAHAGDPSDQKERDGLTAFFRGKYKPAVDALSQIVDEDRPRARLYLAYAQAALALVETDDKRKSELTQAALHTLDGVRARLGRLSADDTRFVSPSIVHLLNLDALR